ncbi:unnamed protein product [Penicillium manginii]
MVGQLLDKSTTSVFKTTTTTTTATGSLRIAPDLPFLCKNAMITMPGVKLGTVVTAVAAVNIVATMAAGDSRNCPDSRDCRVHH